MERSHIPILRTVYKKKPRKPIRKVSKKQSRRLKEYMAVRADFLLKNPYCEYYWAQNVVRRATEIHHRMGRIGPLLTDARYFMAVSEEGHRAIHANPKRSYEMGYMLPRSIKVPVNTGEFGQLK